MAKRKPPPASQERPPDTAATNANTEVKRAEKALRENEERDIRLAKTLGAAVFILHGTDLAYVNPAGQRMTGYSFDELRSMSFTEILPPEDREQVTQWIVSGGRDGMSASPYRHRLLTKDGEVRWVEVSATGTHFEGRPAVVEFALDITERKQAEEALRESEERYRKLYTKTPAMVHSIDTDGNLVTVSDHWLMVLGYERNEVIGQKSLEFLTAESQQYAETVVLPNFWKTGECRQVPYQFVKKNGEIVDVLLSAIVERDLEGNVVRSLAVLDDITERKQAEEALRESEARLRELIESSLDGILAYDTELRYTVWNPGMERMSGFDKSQALGHRAFERFPFLNDSPEGDAYHRAIEGKTTVVRDTPYTVPETGHQGYLEGVHVPLRDAEGRIIGGMGIVREITERKRSEEALRESEARLRNIFEAGFEGLVIHHNNGVILDANPAFEQMSGYQLSELAGMRILDLVAEESRDLVMQRLKKPLYKLFEAVALKKDGTRFYVEVIARGEHIYKGQPVRISAVRDITERKRLEEKLQQAREALEGRVERQMLHNNPYGLTFREFTVLHHVAAGKADKEIAHQLGISPLTVHKHVANILSKMKAASRTEAAARALREGLLD